MQQKQYSKGELIFSQGDEGTYVCHVRSGKVEIFIDQGTSELVLGTVGDGEFMGEMSVIGGLHSRSASARATSEVVVDVLDRAEFLHKVSNDVNLAQRVLERLSERLRDSNNRLAAAEPRTPDPSTTVSRKIEELTTPKLTLFAGNASLEAYIPEAGLEIDELPFSVGRFSEHPGTNINRPDMTIEDMVPFRLSRHHFAIVYAGDSIAVQDLHSTLGTQVNELPIGEHFGIDSAILKPGENIVVAGGHQSPFVFRICVG